MLCDDLGMVTVVCRYRQAFGDSSLIFVYDFHPDVETLMHRHFSSSNPHKDVWRPAALIARMNPDPSRPYSQQGDPRDGQCMLALFSVDVPLVGDGGG